MIRLHEEFVVPREARRRVSGSHGGRLSRVVLESLFNPERRDRSRRKSLLNRKLVRQPGFRSTLYSRRVPMVWLVDARQ